MTTRLKGSAAFAYINIHKSRSCITGCRERWVWRKIVRKTLSSSLTGACRISGAYGPDLGSDCAPWVHSVWHLCSGQEPAIHWDDRLRGVGGRCPARSLSSVHLFEMSAVRYAHQTGLFSVGLALSWLRCPVDTAWLSAWRVTVSNRQRVTFR